MQNLDSHNSEIQALHALMHGVNTEPCNPEVLISLVSRVLRSVDLLTREDNTSFRAYVSRVFPVLRDYASTSTNATVKKTVGSCALLLQNEDDMMQFFYEAYRIGDVECLFVLIEYLTLLGQEERIKSLLTYAWEEWKSIHKEINEEKRSFIYSLSRYAFRASCDDIGLEIASILEGKTMGEYDPNILKYRTSLRTPSEYSFALGEVLELYFTGNSQSVIMDLLSSVHEYVESQITHLQSHQSIEPEMLRYLESFQGEDLDEQVNYETSEGKNYFALQNYFILAILYGDIARAEYIISLLESDENIPYSLADIVLDLSLIDDSEEEGAHKTTEQLVYEGVLVPFLRIYQGIEYAGVHTRIYALMKKMTPLLSQEAIRCNEANTMRRTYRLSHSGIAQYYLPILTEANMTLHNIVRIHILDAVSMGSMLKNPQNPLAIAYYALEYFLLHGTFPIMSEDSRDSMVQLPMSPAIRSFFEVYYKMPSLMDDTTSA